MKKSIKIIILIVSAIILILIGIILGNNLPLQEKISSIEDNSDYIYVCVIKQNSNTIKTFFTTDEKTIKENKCNKYKKITCIDVNNKVYKCSEVNAQGLFSTQAYSYFTYKIDGKEYIKDFLTDKYVVDPSEYDSFEWKNGAIVFHIGDKQKIYESSAQDYRSYYGYSDYKDYEVIDNFMYNRETGPIILQNKEGNIRVYISGGTYLNDIKVDKVLYASDDKRIFITDGNHIKLYEKNNLLWDYGEFEEISKIKFITSTGDLEGTMVYAFKRDNEDSSFYLIYNPSTKTGTISYTNHN